MEIVQLGEGVLLVNKQDDESVPRVLLLDGRTYFRFMDRLFLPCRTHELNIGQIKVINRFRESSFSYDEQFELNVSVKRRVAAALQAVGCSSVLEIGCGKFPLRDYYPNASRYLCIEADDDAICANRNAGIACCSLADCDLQCQGFDAFVALFVLQFSIEKKLFKFVHERTAPTAMGIVNLVAVDQDLRSSRLDALREVGFHIVSVPDVHPMLKKNEFIILQKQINCKADSTRASIIATQLRLIE